MNYSLEHFSALLKAGERLSLLDLPDVQISRFLRLSIGADRQPFALISDNDLTSMGNVLEVGRTTRQLIQLVFASSGFIEVQSTSISFGLFFTSAHKADILSIICGARERVSSCNVLYSDGSDLNTCTADGQFSLLIPVNKCSPSVLLSIWSGQTDTEFVELESVIYTSSMLSNWILRQTCGFVSDVSPANLRSSYKTLVANGFIRENCEWKSDGN